MWMRMFVCAGVAGLLSAVVGAQEWEVWAALREFPCHWERAGLYDERIVEEGGASSVAVAGAAVLEFFRMPTVLDGKQLAWDRLGPGLQPLDARGRETAQTVVSELHQQVGEDFGALAKVLRETFGYASATAVEVGTGEAEALVEASVRCGSPVVLKVVSGAVVACGYREANGSREALLVLGNHTEPAWHPLTGEYAVSAAITNIVLTRPEGVDAAASAIPILGTVRDEADNPVPLTTVTLTAEGIVLGESATDTEGHFALWGWGDLSLTLSCGGDSQVYAGEPLLFTLPGSAQPTIHTDLETALAAAQAASDKDLKRILCLDSESPALKARFLEQADKCTLLYADPRLPSPFPEAASRPDALFFLLNENGEIEGFHVKEDPTSLDLFIKSPTRVFYTSYSSTGEPIAWDNNMNGADINVGLTSSSDILTVTVDTACRFGLLTLKNDLILTGQGTCSWATLDQQGAASLTLDGPNFRYVPPYVDGKSSAINGDFTVRNGAELFFANGDVSGYNYDRYRGSIIIEEGGILCVAKRDTLRRPLVLTGGTVQLGDSEADGGSLDLLSTPISVTAASTVEALSGAVNPRLKIRAKDGDPVTITFKESARLDVSVPVVAEEGAALTLKGTGTAAFQDVVFAPTTVNKNVRLEGGTFPGGLTLNEGAILTTEAPITVAGAVSAAGVAVEGGAGDFLTGEVAALDASGFLPPEGFLVRKGTDRLSLVPANAAFVSATTGEALTFSDTAAGKLTAVAADLAGPIAVAAQTADGRPLPAETAGDALDCLSDLKPEVVGGQVVVAYDFGIVDARIEGDEVVLTLAARGKDGSPLTFTEGAVCAIEGLEGSAQAATGNACSLRIPRSAANRPLRPLLFPKAP